MECFQRHALAALYPGERTPGTHCTGGWVGLRAGLDTEVRGKTLSPLSGIEPRSPGRPVRSQTLHWLSYPANNLFKISNSVSFVKAYVSDMRRRKSLSLSLSLSPSRSCLRPAQSIHDLWWAKWHWKRFLSESFWYSLSVSFHHCFIFTHVSYGGWSMDSLATAVH
jgi:hypothetical protein